MATQRSLTLRLLSLMLGVLVLACTPAFGQGTRFVTKTVTLSVSDFARVNTANSAGGFATSKTFTLSSVPLVKSGGNVVNSPVGTPFTTTLFVWANAASTLKTSSNTVTLTGPSPGNAKSVTGTLTWPGGVAGVTGTAVAIGSSAASKVLTLTVSQAAPSGGWDGNYTSGNITVTITVP